MPHDTEDCTTESNPKTLGDLARLVGPYPEEAFLFIREGLGFAARRVHGPETAVHKALQSFLSENDLDWNELVARYLSESLPEPIVRLVDEAGGWQKLNRHISGRELCWGLRDYALRRWGLLARLVLDTWHIRRTEDFGKIVFGFIAADLLQKQPDDSIDDFRDVFSFADAFDEGFRTAVCGDVDAD